MPHRATSPVGRSTLTAICLTIVVVVFVAACKTNPPENDDVDACMADTSAPTTQLTCYMTTSGKLADTVNLLAQRLQGFLSTQPRISNLSVDVYSMSNGTHASEIKYTFRGPRKLADQVLSLAATTQQAPAGYNISVGQKRGR